MKIETSTDDLTDIDYPCSDLFAEYHEELQGKIFPFTPIDIKPLHEEDLSDEEFFKHPRIVATLQAMGIITIFKSKKDYQNSDKVEINELKGVPL